MLGLQDQERWIHEMKAKIQMQGLLICLSEQDSHSCKLQWCRYLERLLHLKTDIRWAFRQVLNQRANRAEETRRLCPSEESTDTKTDYSPCRYDVLLKHWSNGFQRCSREENNPLPARDQWKCFWLQTLSERTTRWMMGYRRYRLWWKKRTTRMIRRYPHSDVPVSSGGHHSEVCYQKTKDSSQ